MFKLELSSLTAQYMPVVVDPPKLNGLPYDPTADAVEIAITAYPQNASTPNDPVNTDWKSATWITNAVTTPATYIAVLLVQNMAKGTYGVWVRVHDQSEVPVILAGLVTFT